MFDFLKISARMTKGGTFEIKPKFVMRNPSRHLMIRGGDFYAIWVEEKGLWSTSEQDAVDLIDRELDEYVKENAAHFENGCHVLYMWDAESGSIDRWHKYCQKQMRDTYHMLDEKLIFSNTKTGIEDYASKRLSYPLEKGEAPCWNRLLDVLYSPSERKKIEWAIGSIVSGDSRKLQKFMVFYGAAGTGKSTIIGIIEKLFSGYTSTFDSKALGDSRNNFALEPFKKNPLVAIEHDGDLSRIEDNTRINSLVSHEKMSVNEKFSKMYENDFKCFLFMGTNRPVKITDAKSGLLRRLIDVSPTGLKLKPAEYKQLMKGIDFELGAIAYRCMEVYKSDPEAYDDYIPLSMMAASNDFYNFITYPDVWEVFVKQDETTAKAAWTMYKNYCEEAKVVYPYSLRPFKEELKNYFRSFSEREILPDGTRARSYYKGFRLDKFEWEGDEPQPKQIAAEKAPDGLEKLGLKKQESLLDKLCAECPAQYANDAGTPVRKWAEVTTKLKDIDTKKTHYVKVPENHIVIDFDIPGEDGEKDLYRNIEEAAKWPKTYAELSRSGKAVHLHYIYRGDVTQLSSVYADHIEVKVYTGNMSLRRKRTLCNDLPVSEISSGLPLKEAKKTVNFDAVKSEKGLRALIKRNLDKEIHNSTKSSIDFIFKILEDAYADETLSYDVSDLKNAVLAFAAHSTHQADYCVKLWGRMKFKSADREREPQKESEAPIVFFDVEVFPNLFLVNWKLQGEGKKVVRMINPTPAEIEELLRYRLIGFNCRRYDNHILYARLMGYTNEQLYKLSQRIVSGGKRSDAFFGEAYDISYTDVYDFASAGNKQSLKKFEIELGIHHQELGLPWDKPVPEELWTQVAEYCDNDVLATEAVFEHLSADWTARKILADIAGMKVNDTTNSLTTRIIFGTNKHPQNEFCYRDLSQPVYELNPEVEAFLREHFPEMMAAPHGEAKSLLPYFPGYKYENGVSTYRGEEVGEGGYVYAEPGMYIEVGLDDSTSHHPHSAITECHFGPQYTKVFWELVYGRVYIKHEDWDKLKDILGGKLIPYIDKIKAGEINGKDLSNALKTAINSVYGLTSAAFSNPFKDPRNRDNIVAKRGALFMIDLKHAVQEKGYTVAHIKTDSIKIPNADPEIIRFVMDFGKRYGYTFEHEATYDRMCLVNDAVYIARYKDGKHAGEWTATGKQFQVPYVFKTLFSREPLVFEDLCETFSVSGALYLDMNEDLTDVSALEEELSRREYNAVHGEKPKRLMAEYAQLDDGALKEEIAKGHAYHFVGKVGQFTPIKKGLGGGVLLREADGKYAAATGSKGYRWLESEMVKSLGKENDVDLNYYRHLVDEAREAVDKYGDFAWFVSDDHPPEGDAHDGV